MKSSRQAQEERRHFLNFVPALLLQHLLDAQPRALPLLQSFDAVVMFADIRYAHPSLTQRVY